MNLHEQLGALEVGVDQLIQAVVAPQAQNTPETPADTAAAGAPANQAAHAAPQLAPAHADDATPAARDAVTQAAAEAVAQTTETPEDRPTLAIGRPGQNEITMTIGGKTVSLHPEQVGQLIEELSNARASMKPEPAMGVPTGWRFVSTRNPVMAVQKQSNGDRLLVMRHTGHGWVPFTFSPDMVIQMYMMLTKG
jgi:pyruvate/2-oxoglutarate dehydrogenase complex dihydrolipoamide acyltransferase (E2) component